MNLFATRSAGVKRRLAGIGLAGALAAAVPLLAPTTSPASATPLAGFSWPGDWTSVNRDYDNSRSNPIEFQINPSTVAKLKVKWKVTDLKGSTSVPAVVNGVVYLTAWDGTTRAYNATTGKLLWKTLITKGYYTLGEDGLSHGAVSASPNVVNGVVYVGTEEGWVYALNASDGSVKWKFQTYTNDRTTIWSSPVVVDGRVIIGTGSTDVFSSAGPYQSTGSVFSLDADTGKQQWVWKATNADATSGAGVSIWSSAAVDPGLHQIFIGTGQNVTAPASQYEDSLVSLDYTTGKVVWHRQYSTNDYFNLYQLPWGDDYDLGASPNLFSINGKAVVGEGDKGGNYQVFERDNGTPIWGRHLTDGSHLGGVMQTAAYRDNVIYVASNTMPDAVAWEDGSNTLSVFALNAATGAIIWRHELPTPGWGALTLANGVLYVPTIKGGLYTLKATDGTQVGELKPSGSDIGTSSNALGAGPAVANGMVYQGYGFWFLNPSLAGTDSGGFTAFGF